MKRLLLCLISCCFLYGFAECQTYNELKDSAAKARERKDYATAFRLLTAGMRLMKEPWHNDLYDAAVLASLSGNSDSALFYLDRLLGTGEIDMILYDVQGDPDLSYFKKDGRWFQLWNRAQGLKNDRHLREIAAIAESVRYQDSLIAFSDSALDGLAAPGLSGRALLQRLEHYDRYPAIDDRHRRHLLAFPLLINDSTCSFYTVQLPRNYDPSVSYPMLLVLHGAVFINSMFPEPSGMSDAGDVDTMGMNQFFAQLGYQHNMIVVYPHANVNFNWMYPDDGFGMIPAIIRDLRKCLNIDDNRVYISGHSNGATGVMSYLLKDPSIFAGFYGFNSNPRVSTGGTFIRNAINRSYFNVATDKDYYFPVSGHDTLARLATAMGIDWQNHVYKGFPHWFPQFKESLPAFQLMFRDMAGRVRNPFQNKLYWECDDVRHGRCDWINIDRLDTLAEKKEWQQRPNFTATHWINNRDTAKVSDTVITAFRFSRLSGAVRARYAANRFDIESSRVKAVSLFLSPEMIDMTRPVVVYWNGKKVFDRVVDYDRALMLAGFRENFDRKAIWVNRIRLVE